MNQLIKDVPKALSYVLAYAEEIGFEMAADLQTGSLLRTLVASKPGSRVLELGTGIGASLCWIVDGLDKDSQVISLDNNSKSISMVQDLLANDSRVTLICEDAHEWINNYQGSRFDVIFADAWPGKYSQAPAVLDMLNPGGLYVVDDMNPQPNWPKGHEKHVSILVEYLSSRSDLVVTQLNWSTGIIIAVKA